MSISKERFKELEQDFYKSRPLSITPDEMIWLIEEFHILQHEKAELEGQLAIVGQVAQDESRERQRLQTEKAAEGLFDPRITDYLKSRVPS